MKSPEALNALWRGISWGLETAGVAAIVLGALATTSIFIWQSLKEGSVRPAYTRFRNGFGRAILLGLEFLVAADIVRTVAIGPTLQDLSVLGLLVLNSHLPELCPGSRNHWPLALGRGAAGAERGLTHGPESG